MSSWSSIRIGGTEYGGSQRYISDRQADLFNSSDLITIGTEGEEGFQRSYRITVKELRTRLEALGYTLSQVQNDVIASIGALKDKQIQSFDENAKKFIEHIKTISIDQLITVATEWRAQESEARHAAMMFPNYEDFSVALLGLLQGDAVPLLNEEVWMNGHHFERLLCEAYKDEDFFELDFTHLVYAGYYEPGDEPLGNRYDEELASISPGRFKMGQEIGEEESDILEFKSVDGANPCKIISKVVVRYAIGFLNRNGGRLLFGVGDDGVVAGVKLSRQDRDELSRQINSACAVIVPPIPAGTIVTTLYPIVGAGRHLDDEFVVEVVVNRHKATEMYFNTSGETWVRIGTETRALKGHELFVHICAHYSQADVLVTALSDRARIAVDEVQRLRDEGMQSESVIASKQKEVDDLNRALSTFNGLLEDTNLLCPTCRAPLITRQSFTVAGNIGDREVEADVEYFEYTCGYAYRDDLTTPISECRHAGIVVSDVVG